MVFGIAVSVFGGDDDSGMFRVRFEEEIMKDIISGDFQRSVAERESTPSVIVEAIALLTPVKEQDIVPAGDVEAMMLVAPGDFVAYSGQTLETMLCADRQEQEEFPELQIEFERDFHLENSLKSVLSPDGEESAGPIGEIDGLLERTRFVSSREIMGLLESEE